MTPSVSKSKDVNNFEEVLKEFEEKFIAFENVYADKDELKAFIVSKLFEAEKRGKIEAYKLFLEIIKNIKQKFPNSKEFEIVVDVRDIEKSIDYFSQGDLLTNSPKQATSEDIHKEVPKVGEMKAIRSKA